jgi:preprotein translocase subunit SecY
MPTILSTGILVCNFLFFYNGFFRYVSQLILYIMCMLIFCLFSILFLKIKLEARNFSRALPGAGAGCPGQMRGMGMSGTSQR